jgi:hypothetical protein
VNRSGCGAKIEGKIKAMKKQRRDRKKRIGKEILVAMRSLNTRLAGITGGGFSEGLMVCVRAYGLCEANHVVLFEALDIPNPSLSMDRIIKCICTLW